MLAFHRLKPKHEGFSSYSVLFNKKDIGVIHSKRSSTSRKTIWYIEGRSFQEFKTRSDAGRVLASWSTTLIRGAHDFPNPKSKRRI